MRRRKRKIRKLRGRRTVGRGRSKRGRGKGSRMGRGSVKSKGGGKRNFMYIVKYEPERLHVRGFSALKKKDRGINLRDIGRLSPEPEIDLQEYGYSKVLGSGELERPIKIKARKASKKAIEKVKKIGGEIITE